MRCRCALSSAGVPRGDHPAVVHRGEPIEPLRLLHVGGGDHDAHRRSPRADAVDQLPELPARQRVDAGGRLVEDQQVRIVDQRAAQRQLLLHAARQLAGRPVGKRIETGRGEQLRDALLRARLWAGRTGGRRSRGSRTRVKRRVQVAPEALRHVGDARQARAAMLGDRACRRPSAKTSPSWIRRTPAMSASSVDLPTPSGPISPTMQRAGIVEGHVVERDGPAIAMRQRAATSRGMRRHHGSFTASLSGQAAFALGPHDSRCRACRS